MGLSVLCSASCIGKLSRKLLAYCSSHRAYISKCDQRDMSLLIHDMRIEQVRGN